MANYDVKQLKFTKGSDTYIITGETYESKSAASGGTDVSLVTTGEKYTWNNKLSSHQTIKQDGVTGATVNRYGACSTAAATAAKTVSITTGTFSLETGSRVTVKFANANTASSPTLNVNSKGAKNIFHNGAQITTGDNKGMLSGTCEFVYDGTQWHIIGGGTTYSSKSAASGGTDLSLVTTGEKYTWNSKTSNTGTVTKVSTGAGLTGGDVTTTGTIKANLTSETNLTNAAADGTETSGRVYPVRLDKNGKLAVNVPWTADTNTHRTINVNGTQILGNNTTALNLKSGNKTTVSASGGDVTFDINDQVLYGTSSTAAGTQQKAVTITVGTTPTALTAGMRVIVTFSAAHSYNGKPTLKIGSLAAVTVNNGYRYMWNANATVGFTFDGTNFIADTPGVSSTSYYGITKLVDGVASTSTALAATGKGVKTAYDAAVTVMTGASSSVAGAAGRVPAPGIGDQTKYLKGDGTWDIPEGSRVYVVDLDDVTNTSGSYTHTTTVSGVSSGFKCVLIECGNPEIFGAPVTVTTGEGMITLACDSVAGTSTVKVSLLMQGNADPLTSNEYSELSTRVGALSSLTTTNKTSIVNSINSLNENNVKFPDYSDEITTIFSANLTWTATDDCVVTGWIDNYNTVDANVFVDDALVGYGANSTCSVWVPVKKGQVVKTRDSGGRYNLHVYRLK